MSPKTRKQTTKPINNAQITRIHVLIHALQIDDDTYRAVLADRYGINTCKDLSMNQAQTFITELETTLRKSGSPKPQQKAAMETPAPKLRRFEEMDGRPGMATGAQLRRITWQWEDISIIPDQIARNKALRQFVRRVAKVSDLRFLDLQGASAVINALNAIQKRDEEKQGKRPTLQDASQGV